MDEIPRCPQCGQELGDEGVIQGWKTRPPFGYTVKDGRLVILEHEAEVVRRIFKMRFIEDPKPAYHIIAYRLRDAGIPTKTGDGLWAPDSVRRILFNPVYQGKVRLKGEVFNSVHEAIVPPRELDESDSEYAEKLKEFME